MEKFTFYNFNRIKGYRNFIKGAHLALKHALEVFLSVKVRLQPDPIDVYRELFQIDIVDNPNHSVYILKRGSILLISYARIENCFFMLGMKLDSPLLHYFKEYALLNKIANTITKYLCRNAKNSFKYCLPNFDSSLITDAISNYIVFGQYNAAKVHFLINKFKDIRSTTFEGKYFSTGIIITKSMHAYMDQTKCGEYVKLSKELEYNIYEDQGKRFWFLANGTESFFLTDYKWGIINSIFIYDGDGDYVSNLLLESTLNGADVMMRVDNGRELSIVKSNGSEFIHQEDAWRYRDYKMLKMLFQDTLNVSNEMFTHLLKYVLRCSKNDTSAIIWIPKDIKSIYSLISSGTMHQILLTGASNESLNITDPTISSVIDRLLASDGALVIDKDGIILGYGAFADLSQNIVEGVKGSGESAASILAQNGIAIKISQDGPIHIFMDNNSITF